MKKWITIIAVLSSIGWSQETDKHANVFLPQWAGMAFSFGEFWYPSNHPQFGDTSKNLRKDLNSAFSFSFGVQGSAIWQLFNKFHFRSEFDYSYRRVKYETPPEYYPVHIQYTFHDLSLNELLQYRIESKKNYFVFLNAGPSFSFFPKAREAVEFSDFYANPSTETEVQDLTNSPTVSGILGFGVRGRSRLSFEFRYFRGFQSVFTDNETTMNGWMILLGQEI